MNVKITPSKLSGEIIAPPSKSYAHRLIIAAFLTDEEVTIKNAGQSKDVKATVNALNALGGNITEIGGVVTVKKRKVITEKVVVNCDESGSTLRFLIPVAAALGINARFVGNGRLMERPIKDLADCIEKHGVTVCGHTVKGKLLSGKFEINAAVSSQYVTGLFFALSALSGDSEIVLKGDAVSVGYLDITIDVFSKFGVEIKKTDNGYFVKGNQKFIAPTKAVVEGDYSGAAFTLAMGAIGGDVTVKGLKADSKQGDAAILSVLKAFGADVTKTDDYVRVKRDKLTAIEVDCENIPDLAQIISVVAAYADGVSVLKNVDRLRIKESDRINAIISTLKNSGVRSEYKNGSLFVYGGEPKGGIFDGGNDHRTVMSAIALSTYADGESKILGAKAYEKSYPDFLSDYELLGGKAYVEV